MFLSRFWTLLLVIFAALMLAISLLAKDMVNREREENATSQLYSELEKMDVGFTLFARKRLDVIVSISADADVRKYISVSNGTLAKRDEIRPKLLNILEKRNGELNQYKADMLLALDKEGKVVVKAGSKGRQNDFSLAGFPVVDAALRGYVRDDVWKLGSDVYLIGVRPVIEDDSYVGAIVHGIQINDLLAARFSKTSQIAFYSGSVMNAVGNIDNTPIKFAKEAAISEGLSKIQSQKRYQEKGRSEPIRFTDNGEDFLGIYSKIRGEAALNDVGWVVITSVSPQIELPSIYEQAGTQDIKNLPLGLIIGSSVLLLLLGWFWNYFESERPIHKLYKAIDALGTSDVKDQLNVYKYKRNVRKIAKSFNKVMDYKMKEVMNGVVNTGSSSSSSSLDSILGDQGGVRLSSASFKFAEDTSGDVPLPPSALDAPPPDAKPRPISSGIKPLAPGRPPTKPQKPLSAGALGAPSNVDEIAYFKEVHKDFVALKQKLGEPVDQLTFERFEVTLKKNRDALKARYGCKSVKFNVYEKDGKASLKAIPFK
ncbi:MAG: hypothetical protein JXR91_15630 [Deltaproteobacteria bacterium]|nr:hypothetical protein [Deltaproteobacteria bacterium]